MGFTFGIITAGGQNAFIHTIIDSIEEEAIPEYEIIVVGAFHYPREHTRLIDFDEKTGPPSWITRKKNIIAEVAKYETIVFLHDYIALEKGWYKGFLQFMQETPEWDVAMCKIKEENGDRAIDWMGLPNDPKYGNVLLPYEYKNPKGMYIPGNFFIAKKELLLREPLDETRGWMECEDIEWSKRIFGGADTSEWLRKILRKPLDIDIPDPINPAKYAMNTYSSVVYLKEKVTPTSFRSPYDFHSGDNSRPSGFQKEDYEYLEKRPSKVSV